MTDARRRFIEAWNNSLNISHRFQRQFRHQG